MEEDDSLIIRNLSLTVDQRLEEHQMALDLVFELEKAGRELNGSEESQPSS